MRSRRLIRGALALAVIVAVAYFFTRALQEHEFELRDANVHLGWWAAAVVALFVAAVGASALLWGAILARLGDRPLGRAEALRVHFASWLLKYIPGQAGFVVNKVVWGSRRGWARAPVLLSVVYENAFLLIGSTVPMVAILAVAAALPHGEAGTVPAAVWLSLAAVVPLLTVTHPRLFRWAVNLLARRVLKEPVPTSSFLRSRPALGFQLAYLVPRIVNGVGVAFAAVALTGAAAHTWIPLGAAYAVAGAAGILAVFVPSGLGVRESVFVALAAPLIGLPEAIVLALVARVLSTVADAVIGIFYAGLTWAARRGGKAS